MNVQFLRQVLAILIFFDVACLYLDLTIMVFLILMRRPYEADFDDSVRFQPFRIG